MQQNQSITVTNTITEMNMTTENLWQAAVAVLGALGGLDLLKWTANLIMNRRNNARMADSQADLSEFHTMKEMIEFLQQQLKEKEERFAEQTGLVRSLNGEVISLTQAKAAVELDLALHRCDNLTCPHRLPPNAFTSVNTKTN